MFLQYNFHLLLPVLAGQLLNTGAKARECTAAQTCSKEKQKCGKHML